MDKSKDLPVREHPNLAKAAGEMILVVEDDRDLRRILLETLVALNYPVRDAGDGRDALAILSEDDEVDLLLTDVALPGGLVGPEIAIKAREMRPGLPVIYMSGYTQDANIMGEGAISEVDLLKKPFNIADLAQRLRTALEN